MAELKGVTLNEVILAIKHTEGGKKAFKQMLGLALKNYAAM